MSLQSLRQVTWLRTALAALLLCFALGTLANAGHIHHRQTADAHEQCDFCHSFGGLIDAPQAITQQVFVSLSEQNTTELESVHHNATVVGLPQARAPPTC